MLLIFSRIENGEEVVRYAYSYDEHMDGIICFDSATKTVYIEKPCTMYDSKYENSRETTKMLFADRVIKNGFPDTAMVATA